MTSPDEGLVWGTTRRKRTSPEAARSRTASSSFTPPSVRLAITRTSFTGSASSSLTWYSLAWHRRDARAGSDRGGGRREDAVDGAGDAVLIRTADDRRNAVEVEDRRRRGHLPLECHAAPGVGWGLRPAT